MWRCSEEIYRLLMVTMKSQHQPGTKVGCKPSNLPLKTHFKFKLKRSVWFFNTHLHFLWDLCICAYSKCDFEGCLKVSRIFKNYFRDLKWPCGFRFLSKTVTVNNLDGTLKPFVDASALKSRFKPQIPRKAFLFQSALQWLCFIPVDFTEKKKILCVICVRLDWLQTETIDLGPIILRLPINCPLWLFTLA